MDDDVAIVGIGLRFPGEANSPVKLWKVLETGQSQWSEIPEDRINIDGYYHPGGDRQGSFFAMTADEARAVDPQQRILLEATYEALENGVWSSKRRGGKIDGLILRDAAGIRKEQVDDNDTAVYVGSLSSKLIIHSFLLDYEQICLRDPDWQPQYAATGNGIAIMANRISYAFNFHGPSVTLDTGCSASLVAVHLAAQNLRNGEVSMAIAAGAGMILTPNTIMPMTALNFLSPDGKCFTFDSRANGYGRGEGIGVVVMKRLSDALRDNDPIRAVIRGSRLNQDGRTTGITLPSKEAQVSNISALYKSMGFDFDQTGYVECHGTGTQAGDWRELKAISETIASTRHVDNPVVVGSVKPNIGHLEGAAGVAGLIKAVLALEHGKIPPNINFKTPNPNIDFEGWKVKVPTSLMDWPVPGIRRASVNCFGFGGTNAHVIIDEASGHLASHGLVSKLEPLSVDGLTSNGHSEPTPHLFCFSSNERLGVQRVINSQIPYVESALDNTEPHFMDNYAYTLGCRRSILEWKTAIVASSEEQLIYKMKSVDPDSFRRFPVERKPGLCFIFCGQGAQWARMGCDLLDYEVFRNSLQEASDYMKASLDSQFTLMDEMMKHADESRISSPEISQPATTALQIALVDLMHSMGVHAAQLIGHSSGEIAAAFASGTLSREDAWRIAYHRGVAAASISVKDPELKGGMIAVEMTEAEAQEYLAPASLSAQIACINSPRSITISGEESAIGYISQDLTSKGVFNRVLNVNVAYHSDHMKLVGPDYTNSLGPINTCSTGSGTVLSSVTGSAVTAEELGTEYWEKNMSSPVRYLSAVCQLLASPKEKMPEIMLELGPRDTLKAPTNDILKESKLGKKTPRYLSVLKPRVPGSESLLNAIGELWASGYDADMEAVIRRKSGNGEAKTLRCLTDLPPYPWNHDRSYWHESHLGKANRFRQYPRQDLIGAPTADSIPFEPRWRGFLRVSENPWIHDHQVQKTIVYPAAGMAAMVIEGAKQMAFELQPSLLGYEIMNMHIEKAMIIPPTEHGLETALNIKRDMGRLHEAKISGSHEFAVYSKQLDGLWEKHATGHLRFRYKDGMLDPVPHLIEHKYQEASKSCVEAVNPRQLYELLDTVGINYGPLFQNIRGLHRGGRSCVADVYIPDTKSKMPANFEYPHLIHPATLDSMMQTLFAIEPIPMVPTFIESLFVSSDLDKHDSSHFSGYSTAERSGIDGAKAEVVMRLEGANGSRVTINGLHLTRIAEAGPENSSFLPNHHSLCSEIVWKEDVAFASPSSVSEHLELLAHRYPGLSVLQVGGTSATALSILQKLTTLDKTPKLSRYAIAELSGGEYSAVHRLLEGTTLQSYVGTVQLDNNCEPATDYHYILCFSNSGIETGSLKKYLKPDGWLVTDCNLGRQDDDGNRIFLNDSNKLVSPDDFGEFTATRSPIPDSARKQSDVVVLYSQGWEEEAQSFLNELLTTAVSEGILVNMTIVPLQRVMSGDTQSISGKVIISILDLTLQSKSYGFVYGWNEMEFEAFHTIQGMASGLIWITRGANMESSNPRASPIIALSRTLIAEDAQKTIVTFDLDIETNLCAEHVSPAVMEVFQRTFMQADGPGPKETELSERNGKVYIPRLTMIDGLNQLIETGWTSSAMEYLPFVTENPTSTGKGLRLRISSPGLMKCSVHFSEFELGTLGPEEVSVELQHAPLSFRDLEVAQGRTTESRVGMDVIGKIERIGSGVWHMDKTLLPGTQVVAMVPQGGSIQSIVHADARFVSAIAPLGFVPSYYVSAYYALVHIGRVSGQPRRRMVLVHAGASCFGVAAIRLCQISGAHALASVLGPAVDEQKAFLRLLGLADEQILDGNSSEAMGKAIKLATDGRGVDVLYSPTHEGLGLATARVVPSSGTFVGFDIGQMMGEDADFVAHLFRKTIKFVENYHLEPYAPYPEKAVTTDFDIGSVQSAFEHLRANPFFGHACLRVGSASTVPVPTAENTKSLSEAVDPYGTYVLAGGLGGLGRSIAELLADAGARHFAFISRSGATSGAAKEFLDGLSQRRINVRVICADIRDLALLSKAVVENLSSSAMPPVRGVFQCAAVIKDSIFENMSYEDWTAAFHPKVLGSENLVSCFTDKIGGQDHQPFFVFLSSSSGVVGTRSQANYAAGNCFEDALARNLRASGIHAVSLNLGPVLGTGMLADDEAVLDMLKAGGFYGIRHEDFLKLVKHAVTGETLSGVPTPPQVTLGVGTGGLLLQNQPTDPYWSRTALWSHLDLVDRPPPSSGDEQDGSSNGKVEMKAMLAACTDVGAATDSITSGLMHMLAKAMNMLFEEMDPHKSPTAYGVDSLVAVGVRNWVFTNCGVNISVFEVLSDRTVEELAEMVVEKGGFGTID
ncbi:Acyl transferase domain in polyketide synthase (PKS) enzyme [Geosmithia morbida]|uniref:Acyl transferase domain in polyketide synthase (PKS) enzyme n=1 Tax=Geosmithia morbida TaxID=1094350 RepID=A0A9P5D5Q1_9HYPO|nr:Acyl transferase domain in polyketide synthase (PKS) enzyme [Geosmithia morbida]KAF4124786.1 Acyl transferase domain in polyketide synthase (PKS) enzyme [Geosmithia morbida]